MKHGRERVVDEMKKRRKKSGLMLLFFQEFSQQRHKYKSSMHMFPVHFFSSLTMSLLCILILTRISIFNVFLTLHSLSISGCSPFYNPFFTFPTRRRKLKYENEMWHIICECCVQYFTCVICPFFYNFFCISERKIYAQCYQNVVQHTVSY